MNDWAGWYRRWEEIRGMVEEHLREAGCLAKRSAGSPPTDVRGTEPPEAAREAGNEVPGASPPVRLALAYLATHFDSHVCLRELARIAGCSPSHLSRICRRDTGVTLRAHLTRLRLARAAREVRAGDKIEAVMLGVGYRGKRHFYRIFRNRYGMTPARYRAGVARGHPGQLPPYALTATLPAESCGTNCVLQDEDPPHE